MFHSKLHDKSTFNPFLHNYILIWTHWLKKKAWGQHCGWLVVLGFNATLTAKVISWRSVMHVFPGFLKLVLTQLFFSKPLTTFLTCFRRDERRNMPERKVASNGDQTHNHQVMSPTPLSLNHLGGAGNIVENGEIAWNEQFHLFPLCFLCNLNL